MNRTRKLILILLFLALIPFVASTVLSQTGRETTLDSQAYAGIELQIVSEDGFNWQGSFGPNETPAIGLVLPDGTRLPDGYFSYELRYAPVVDEATQAIMDAARDGAERAAVEAELRASGALPETRIERGAFLIQNGTLVSSSADATDPGLPDTDPPYDRDQVILDDLIVGSSICVGQDCANGEDFGFDTIRLKENNLRIRFLDTSLGSFPGTDWQITANDSASGGQEKFAIDDITNATTPFTIRAQAPTHSLYVAASGRIGFGTSLPLADNHIVQGNTPTIRLEQDGSSGFTPQSWDIAGNEASYFVRDNTHGGRLVFRIRPNAPASSIDVMPDGDVGFGTTNPASALHVRRTNANSLGLTLENSTNRWEIVNTGDKLTIGTFTSGAGLSLDANGNAILGGALTEASSRALKENFAQVDGEQLLAGIDGLPLASWNYITDGEQVRHLGPVAQDFYAAFGLGIDDEHIAPLDASGVSLAGIQALNRLLREQEKELITLQAENENLNARLTELEALVATLLESASE